MSRATSPIVVYAYDQSTESPSRRNSSSNTTSSAAVSVMHSSMKLRREIALGGSKGFAGAENEGSYGRDGSQVTPYTFCTRRSVGRPLSSQPIG